MHEKRASRPTPLATLGGLLALMRPRQWVKNAFVLAPLLFSGNFTQPTALVAAGLACLLFCVASSAIYIINDIGDIERDRRHPTKSKRRPLASGLVPVPAALALLALLYGGLALYWTQAAPPLQATLGVILGYTVLNLAYTFGLKHQPVLDIFCIASGFVLRVLAGAIALGLPLSSWMAITTLSLALYLAAIKRRQELLQSGDGARKVLERYSVALVERYAEMSATCALVFYSLFVMSSKPALAPTIPLVLFGLFRYWYVVDQTGRGESPTDALLGDWQLMATVLAWVGLCGWLLK